MALSIFEQAFGRERTKPAPNTSRRRRSRYDYRTGSWDDGTTQQQADFNEAAARTLSAVQTICDALIPASQGRYSVVFGTKTAMTEFDRKRISLTAQPLYMKGLRLADVADTFTGFVVHEIGHTVISQDTDRVMKEWLEREPVYAPWTKTIMRIANVLDDEALERWAKQRFPGVAHTFRVTTKFVAQDEGLPNKEPRRWDPKGDYATRFNFAVISVRYRWFCRWVGDAATRAERQWWIDWAEQYADPKDPYTRLLGIQAALARIAVKPEDRPEEPKPEPEPQPGGEPSEDEGEDEGEQSEQGDEQPGIEDPDEEPETFDTSDDEGEDDDDAPTSGGNDDDDEPEDGDEDDDDLDGEGDDESDEDGDEGDEPEDGSDEGDDGDDDEDGWKPGKSLDSSRDGTSDDERDDADEGDEPGDDDGEFDGDEDDGEDEDGDSDDDAEPDDERDTERADERTDGARLDPMDEDDLGQQGEGSSEPPIYEGFEPESLPSRETVKTVDDYIEEREKYDSYRDDALMEQVKVEMRTQKVTDAHGFGTMKVVINL